MSVLLYMNSLLHLTISFPINPLNMSSACVCAHLHIHPPPHTLVDWINTLHFISYTIIAYNFSEHKFPNKPMQNDKFDHFLYF